MNTEIKNYGFIPSKIDYPHYIFGDGKLAPPVLMPDGQWDNFLPADQFQSRGTLETENCTNYGTLHALATLGKRKFGAQFQTFLSERYGGIMTGTTINGNDPHKVIELIRTTYGVVPEIFLPFDNSIKTWQQYYGPNPMTYSLYAVGAHWLKKYKVGHDWVWLPTDSKSVVQQKMMDALKYSPLGVSGFAWSQHADGKFYSDQPYFNHWYEINGYVPGQYWKAFDSYDNTHKQLDWNYTFGQGKRYTLDLNVGAEKLGDAPELVLLPYTGYLIGQLISNILK